MEKLLQTISNELVILKKQQGQNLKPYQVPFQANRPPYQADYQG